MSETNSATVLTGGHLIIYSLSIRGFENYRPKYIDFQVIDIRLVTKKHNPIKLLAHSLLHLCPQRRPYFTALFELSKYWPG